MHAHCTVLKWQNFLPWFFSSKKKEKKGGSEFPQFPHLLFQDVGIVVVGKSGFKIPNGNAPLWQTPKVIGRAKEIANLLRKIQIAYMALQNWTDQKIELGYFPDAALETPDKKTLLLLFTCQTTANGQLIRGHKFPPKGLRPSLSCLSSHYLKYNKTIT